MTTTTDFGVDAAQLASIAADLQVAEATRVPIRPLTESYPQLTVAGAYIVQQHVAEARIAAGATVVGHKIGLTSAAMQEMLGVSEPDYGHVFDDITLETGATVDCSALIAPRIEPEIAFVLGRDLPLGGVTKADVLQATEYVTPALEVIDSRIADWKIGLIDTVADNASCARIVLGDRRTAPGEVDLAAETVHLLVDGSSVQHGNGAAVLGHPALAVAWLANALADYGVQLRAGHILMPGSVTAAVPIEPGQVVRADFGTLGSVEVHCA